MAKQLNEHVGAFLDKTLWIWLPFAVLRRLIIEVIEKHEKQ